MTSERDAIVPGEFLAYDAGTGVFVWLERMSRRVRAGDIAGSVHSLGYVHIRIKGRDYKAHRLAWWFISGGWPAEEIDHIDGNRANNAAANLRAATRAENQQNEKGPRANGTSGYLGVSWHRRIGKFGAAICHGGRQRHIGYYQTAEEASAAYLSAKAVLHPFQTICEGLRP